MVPMYGWTISNLMSNPWHSPLSRQSQADCACRNDSLPGCVLKIAVLFLTIAELTVRLTYCPQWLPGGVTFSSLKGAGKSLWPPAVTFSGCSWQWSERTPLRRCFTTDAKSDFRETQVRSNELFGLLATISTERNTCRFSQVHVKCWEA